MMASQLLDHMARNILKSDSPNQMDLTGHPAPGAWLKENIFAPAASLRWDELLIKATGETLNPKYFAEQFVSGK